MDLETFWQQVFSENTPEVLAAWSSLDAQERAAVRELLERIAADEGRIADQRRAARFALAAVAEPAAAPGLPDGAVYFARALAAETAQHLKATFGQISASLKRDGSLLTESDLESDRRLSAAIRARFPAHGVLSEEGDRFFHGQEWCWVIDPIDGTTNFTWGFPVWGVLIALLHRGEPVLGVADFPMTGEQFWAARGQGAWLNEAPIRAMQLDLDAAGRPILQKTHLFTCCTRSIKAGPLQVPMKLRIPGNTGFDLALVAKGVSTGSLDMDVHIWDVAALWPILQESGSIIMSDTATDVFPLREGVDYGDVEFSLLTSSSAALQSMLLETLRGRFPGPSRSG
jgi:myo-inositol-1(or 4)-monophosphatase